MSRIDDIIFFYQESSPDEFREYYKTLDLTEDEKKILNKFEDDQYYQQHLSNLEPLDLYKEVVHWFEHDETIPNRDKYILNLLIAMGRPKPKGVIKSLREKMETIDHFNQHGGTIKEWLSTLIPLKTNEFQWRLKHNLNEKKKKYKRPSKTMEQAIERYGDKKIYKMIQLYDDITEHHKHINNTLTLLKFMGEPRIQKEEIKQKIETIKKIMLSVHLKYRVGKYDNLPPEVRSQIEIEEIEKKDAAIIKEALKNMEPSNPWEKRLENMFNPFVISNSSQLVKTFEPEGLTDAYEEFHHYAVLYGYITPSKK